MTVCPKCKGKAEYFKEVFNDGKHRREILVECDMCHGSGEVLTNEEWLRTLPADERVKEVLSRGFMTEKRTAEEFVKWLEEKHDGNT